MSYLTQESLEAKDRISAILASHGIAEFDGPAVAYVEIPFDARETPNDRLEYKKTKSATLDGAAWLIEQAAIGLRKPAVLWRSPIAVIRDHETGDIVHQMRWVVTEKNIAQYVVDEHAARRRMIRLEVETGASP